MGFAGGYNEGLKNIQEPILCLINSDIEVTDHWLEPILNHFNQYANVASIQPKILDLKDKKNLNTQAEVVVFMIILVMRYAEADISIV